MAGTQIRVDIDPTLEKVDKNIATYSALTSDLRPFWAELGRSLADDAQRRWPLRRRSGKLRRSLKWSGDGLGRGGIYEARPDRLLFGTRIFYASFSQSGTRNQPARALVRVDENAIAARMSAWASERARRSGLEVYA